MTSIITTEDELRAIVGSPIPRVAEKVLTRLGEVHRDWIAASRFVALATSSSDGRCDVSPKGDPAGFVHVLDDRTVVVPERPGNRRVDGYLNVLDNPHVGLLFLIPGRTDTLRVNGSARVVGDAPWFDDLVVNGTKGTQGTKGTKGHRPILALEVSVEEVFFHCSKAFLRGALWQPETWDPEAVPSRAQIAHLLERPDETIEDLEKYYGPHYAENLY
ncbi:MAG: pyridoxamine 5'-phosphate oxidase family protein [Actinomycetota bacterium]|nr:pyridoxamine 5'-phosphate oxidase family protein [Actinomycetota bacterium]